MGEFCGKIERMAKEPVKVNLTSSNLSEEKLKELRSILPDVFSEEKIDWEKLRTVLGDNVDPRVEKFSFTWAGKSAAIKNVITPSTSTLRPAKDESVNFDTTENIFIEGDNLEALKLLQKAYFEKIKFIYIDPPYNTGSDFIYKDDFSSALKGYLSQTGQTDNNGQKLQTNKETSGRFHSDWLSMMYPRLKLAWNLLRSDGMIFVSIDDNEVHRLRMILDEIFGEENFITSFVWHNNVKGRQMDLHIKNTYESILVYSKSSINVSFNTSKETVDVSELEKDEISYYEKDYPLHNGTSEFHINNRPNLAYSIYYSPETSDAKVIDEKVEVEGKLEIGAPTKEGEKLLAKGYVRIIPKYNHTYRNQRVWRWGKEKFLAEYKTELLFVPEDSGYYIYQKKRYENGVAETKYKNYLNIDGGVAKKELFQILDLKVFENPKPVSVIQHLLKIGTGKDDVVLDFFGGSGTTAHAVMALNAEDNGNRKFIVVQLPEVIDHTNAAYKAGYKTIADISKERIRRIVNKFTGGFKVFKLGPSNYPENTFEFDPDKTESENKIAFDNYLKKAKQYSLFEDDENQLDVVFENIIKEGFSLNSKISEVKVGNNNMFVVEDAGRKLLICLDRKVDNNTIKILTGSEYKNQVFICIDQALDDTDKANLGLSLELKTI